MTEISMVTDRLRREKPQGIYISDLGGVSAFRIEDPKIGRELQFYAVCWEKQTDSYGKAWLDKGYVIWQTQLEEFNMAY